MKKLIGLFVRFLVRRRRGIPYTGLYHGHRYPRSNWICTHVIERDCRSHKQRSQN
jgi:hypothetical protein